jgi:hypothetical protein
MRPLALVFCLAAAFFAPGAQVETISFQDGVHPTAAYAGTRDAYVSEGDPDGAFGAAAALFADGDDLPGTGLDLAALLRWELSAIPPGSVIEAVELTLQVTDHSPASYAVYELRAPWVEAEVSWNEAAAGSPWEVPGAQGPQDRASEVLGLVSAAQSGSYSVSLNGAGVAAVQRWVDDPASNHGLIIAATDVNDGVDFVSRESAAVSERPKLTLTYSQVAADSDGDGVPEVVGAGDVVRHVDADEVLVVEGGQQGGLPQEALGSGQGLREDLHGHVPQELAVSGPEHDPVGPGAQPRLRREALGQLRRELDLVRTLHGPQSASDRSRPSRSVR